MADNEHADGADGTEPQRDSAAPFSGENDETAVTEGTPVQDGHPQTQVEQPSAQPASSSQEGRIASTSGLSVFGEGRYRLTRRLGRGGMAEVFAAQDVRLGRTVAVKVLRPDLAEDAIARLRFTREAHAVASLNHHAVVAVYDTGEEAHDGESVPYIVMELVEGHTVRELLQSEEPPPVDQALIISAGILEALAYSHRHGIVHRDIKPANVIITNTGAVKVMDFGIARALTGASSTMTQTGMVMGTPQYLSPEQALGKPVDHRSDLYATGCMLYELLTLRPPFTGDTPLSVVYQHVQDPPVPPSQANGRVPAVLDALVLRSLAKDPDDRFQSADEMRAHLQHALRTMHQGTAMTEVLPAAAAGPADGMAGTRIGDPNALTTAMAQVGNGNQVTPVMGTPQAPAGPNGPGGPRPPAYEDRYDDDHDDRNSRRAIFAVIAVLVAIAAITIGVALAMNKSNGGTPSPADSSTVSSSPSNTPPPTESSTPTDSASATPDASPSPSDSYTPSWSPPVTASASATPSTTPSQTTSATPSDTSSASATPSDSGSATPSDTASSTAKALGGGPDGGN